MVAARTGDRVRIVEVGARDGLQNIKATVPTKVKLELINRLYKAGFPAVELTSIVSPKAIPQLADCREILSNQTVKSLISEGESRTPVLVPNVKGLEVAQKYGVKEVAVFVSASEGFSRANINCSVEEGLQRANAVTQRARDAGLEVRGYVSSIFACPFDGKTDPSAVLNCVKRLLDGGCYEVSLGDTLGVGVPSQTRDLIHYLTSAGIPISRLAGHFHDTYGQAVANVWTAYQCGLRTFDSSVAGLGGCPYAPGAEGNVASEDLVYLFQQAQIPTGVDFEALVETGHWISNQLSRRNASRVGNAHAAKKKQKQSSDAKSKTERLDWRLWSDCSPNDEVLIHQSGVNVRLTLNRPRNGNALTQAMVDRLLSFMESANDKFPEISRIVLTANGKFFCTGMDLSAGGTNVGKDQSSTDQQFNQLTRLFRAIDRCKQTTIACIQGPALGGGTGLAFACNIRLASREATLRLTEVRLGLSPATISKYIVREWGVAFVREAMLAGRIVSVDELKQLGVIAHVSPDQKDLEIHLDKYLTDLKTCAPVAGSMCKDLVYAGWAEAGQEGQEEMMRQVWDKMMKPDSESVFGVAEFQRGRKQVDWDARYTKDQRRTAKL